MAAIKLTRCCIMRSSSIVIMEGKTKRLPFRPAAVSALAGLLLSGCLGEDEQLHRQLQDLRAELKTAEDRAAEAETKVRELSAKVSETPPPAPVSATADPAELKSARERIASLEKELAAAKASPPAATAPTQTAESYKELAKQLQTELMQKVSELSDQLQSQIPSADVQEVTVKRIRPPEEIATAFSSAITFTLLDSSRQPVPLSFPVQAGLDGTWKIPTVEDVKRVYSDMARGIPQSAPAVAAAPSQGAAPAAAQPTQPASAPASGGGSFVKQSDGSILVNWDGNASAAPPAPAPSPALAPAAATLQPPPQVSQPAQPQRPAAPAIPAPVMPVQQDIIVRFE